MCLDSRLQHGNLVAVLVGLINVLLGIFKLITAEIVIAARNMISSATFIVVLLAIALDSSENVETPTLVGDMVMVGTGDVVGSMLGSATQTEAESPAPPLASSTPL